MRAKRRDPFLSEDLIKHDQDLILCTAPLQHKGGVCVLLVSIPSPLSLSLFGSLSDSFCKSLVTGEKMLHCPEL